MTHKNQIHFGELELEVEVRKANGQLKVVERRAAQSFVRNWLGILRSMFDAADYASFLKDTGGNTDTAKMFIDYGSSGSFEFKLNADAAVNDDTFGIQIGTNSTTPAPADYCLTSKINHGTGTGQMSYGAMSIEDCQVSGLDTTFRLIRTFTNNSSASITVKEIGLVVNCKVVGASATKHDDKYLIVHDVITDKAVGVGETLTVRYIPKTTT